MFYGCTSLTSAPELKATTLAPNCYNGMFSGCTKLSTVTMLALNYHIRNAKECCNKWLQDAGTEATSRTLRVQDATAYDALANNPAYLPDNWKKDQCTVKYESTLP